MQAGTGPTAVSSSLLGPVYSVLPCSRTSKVLWCFLPHDIPLQGEILLSTSITSAHSCGENFRNMSLIKKITFPIWKTVWETSFETSTCIFTSKLLQLLPQQSILPLITIQNHPDNLLTSSQIAKFCGSLAAGSLLSDVHQHNCTASPGAAGTSFRQMVKMTGMVEMGVPLQWHFSRFQWKIWF